MNLLFTPEAWEDYQSWREQDPAVLSKIDALLKDCRRSPFSGIGKPEPLKNKLSGWWSRRITAEHRLIYRVEGNTLQIASCRGHYTT